jgi:hypothetical protein
MALVPAERKLVAQMAGKAFALVGVDADTDRPKVRALMEKEKMSWPSFFDGEVPGPIASAWNVHSWPTIYVLDGRGVIRHRDLRGGALATAVAKLVDEKPSPP